jgi:Fe-S-cluster containining protein
MDSFASNPLCLECGLCCNGVIFADARLQPGDNAERLQSLGLTVVSAGETGSRAATNNRTPAATGPSLLRRECPGADGGPKPGGASVSGNRRFAQPCPALDGCRCRIYAERPKYCREFECLLLKRVKSGGLESAGALRVIREARRRADKVERLLRVLGDTDRRSALSVRFRRTSRRLEAGSLDDETAEVFSQLTLAVHDLNLILSEAFYPDGERS